MAKIIMVSKVEFEFDERIMQEDLDFFEAVKDGVIEVGIPEMTLLDEDGNELVDMTNEPKIMEEAMKSIFKIAEAE